MQLESKKHLEDAVVWDVAQEKLPPLHAQVVKLLKEQ